MDAVLQQCKREVAQFVFSEDGSSLEEVLLHMLTARHRTVAAAESCTGGLIAQRLTSLPGSSRYFEGGAVVYSNALKTSFAGVAEEVIQQEGAVSDHVARLLAEGIRSRCGADIGLGVTGIAGPDGATPGKPVGRVYLAISDEYITKSFELNLSGDRERVRWFASQHALVELRRHLL